MPNRGAGGEIDALCTRCKMVLAHTILAIQGGKPARVQCNTCHGQHNYRSPEPAPRLAARTPGSGSATPRDRPSFDVLMATRPTAGRPYSPKATFMADETISHPTFGRGVVADVRRDKIDVVFRGGVKTLVHGRG